MSAFKPPEKVHFKMDPILETTLFLSGVSTALLLVLKQEVYLLMSCNLILSSVIKKICASFLRFLVRVSYLEIYNENVRDLLGKDQKARLEVTTV